MNKCKLLYNIQQGFTLQISNETALIEMAAFIHNEVEAAHAVAGVFYYLSRAFDTLDVNFCSP